MSIYNQLISNRGGKPKEPEEEQRQREELEAAGHETGEERHGQEQTQRLYSDHSWAPRWNPRLFLSTHLVLTPLPPRSYSSGKGCF